MKTIWLVVGVALAFAGCGDGNKGDGGVDQGGQMPPPDLYGIDFFGQPLPDFTVVPPPADMTATSDFAGKPTIKVQWQLLTAMIQGGTNNGFVVACGDKKYPTTALVFSVTSAKGTKMTTLPCPSADSNGNGNLELPDPTGPFKVSGTTKEYPNQSQSEVICDVMTDSNLTVRVYVGGCDQGPCIKTCM